MVLDAAELGPAPDARSEDLVRVESGLDALGAPESERNPRSARRNRLTSAVAPLIAVGLVVLVWQVLVWAHVKPGYVLPSPGDVVATLRSWAADGTLWRAVWTSMRRAVTSFALVLAISTPLGLLIAGVRPLRVAIRPLLTGLQTLPTVAWVPPAVLWFGLTETTMYAVVLLASIPAVTNGLIAGLDQVPPLYRRAGRVLGAKGVSMLRYVLLPAALPAYVAGIRQGWAFAWHGLMTAEVISYSPDLGIGVGHLLDNARQLSDTSAVFASVAVILVLGVAAERLVFAPAERLLLLRRGVHVVR